MKSALLLAHELDFFDQFASRIVEMGGPTAKRSPGYARLTDAEGRHFTLLDEAEPHYMSEFRSESLDWEPGVATFDRSSVTGVVAECRWEDLFIDVVAKAARRLGFPMWVADGNGHVWMADSIDPARLQL